jgi:hypothetical protein
MTTTQSTYKISDRFTSKDEFGHHVAQFNNKAEFNNFKVSLDLKGAKYTSKGHKKTKRQSAYWKVVMTSPIEILD